MIKRIDVIEKDQVSLERLASKNNNRVGQPENYQDRVVLKPWGFEYLFFENDHIAAWFLHINQEHSTSMHCHPKKRTSLIVLDGIASCSTFHHRNEIEALGGIIFEKGVFHTTKSLTGVDIIEIETPPDKTDLVRYNDAYGRENAGYESTSEMCTRNLEQEFGYFWFEEGQAPNFMQTERYSVELVPLTHQKEFESLEIDPEALYVNCSNGDLLNDRGDNLLEVGVATRGSALIKLQPTRLAGRMQLMKVRLS